MNNSIFKFLMGCTAPTMGCGKNIHPTYFEAGFENKK